MRPNDTEFVPAGESSMEALVSSCMGLVIIDKQNIGEYEADSGERKQLDIIRFVHYTAQEFFESIRQQRYPQGHELIAGSPISMSVLYLKPDIQDS